MGEAALGGTKGQNLAFLWRFPPAARSFLPREDGDGAMGKGAGRCSVGDRAPGAVGVGQGSQNKPSCTQRSVLRTGTARAGAESIEQLRKHINAP